MLRDSFVTLERLAEYAERNRINVALNISPYLAEQGEKLLGKILSKTSILVLNDEEARLLTGEHVLERQFLKILNYGVKIIAITLGKNGATASDGRYLYRIKARKVKVIESTGAGGATGGAPFPLGHSYVWPSSFRDPSSLTMTFVPG